MNLASTRTLESLRPVLQEPEAKGPNPVYKVFNDLDEHLKDQGWINQTIIEPGKIGEEYTKTFGHYHSHPRDERYRVESGEGVLILQKGKPDMVGEVLLVRAKAGDEILITPEYGHSWSNIGDKKLVLVDNWKDGHSPGDYQPIEDYQGMAYYLVDQDSPTAIPNPTYKNLPAPQWINAIELQHG
ncbi:MAG: hypothetical protein HY376_00675 [Candidatus Blackburnbacteria bacterium]|nr:hypothetical protein [Candidatus Blackburnbacteria bacterium]